VTAASILAMATARKSKTVEVTMPHALNFAIKIKQDEATLARLKDLERDFPNGIQQKIGDALRESNLVHFARVVVIDNAYLMVITEYDDDPEAYTEFFREKLPDVFGLLFSFAEEPPTRDVLGDKQKFFNLAKNCNYRSLGNSEASLMGVTGESEGYLFSATGEMPVTAILPKINR
jgi:hypothetical protein